MGRFIKETSTRRELSKEEMKKLGVTFEKQEGSWYFYSKEFKSKDEMDRFGDIVPADNSELELSEDD